MDSEDMVGVDQEGQTSIDATANTEETGTNKAPDSTTESAGEAKKEGEAPSDKLEALKPGTRVKGKVRNIVDFGAFIDIGVGRDGLAHISTLKRAGIDKTLKVGDTIDVIVRRVDLDGNRISLTVPGDEGEGKTPLKNLEEGSIVTGKIVRLVDFGAFVDIGAQTDGLLHISEMSSGFVKHPSEVVKIGDEVQVRIIEVDARKRRISLTMKDLEQEQEEEAAGEPNLADMQAESRLPTAFEVAFEEARKRQRRGRK
jgi:small subunit ribosomal protein S1